MHYINFNGDGTYSVYHIKTGVLICRTSIYSRALRKAGF